MALVRSGRVLRLATPFKAVVQRFSFMAMVAFTVAMMTLSAADVVLIERLRSAAGDVVGPFLAFFARPIATVSAMVTETQSMISLRAENVQMKEENARLLQWQRIARRLNEENQALRALSHAVPDAAISYVSGRVVADAGSTFVRADLLNAGLREGVRKGQAVVNERGLVGRITHVGLRTARVLLLTDLSSRIPVSIEANGERAILVGENAGLPRLAHLLPNAKVKAGDRIVTAGQVGAFPPGLPVGEVAEVADGAVRVQPYADLDRLDYVEVVNFGLEELTDSPAEPAPVQASQDEPGTQPVAPQPNAARQGPSN